MRIFPFAVALQNDFVTIPFLRERFGHFDNFLPDAFAPVSRVRHDIFDKTDGFAAMSQVWNNGDVATGNQLSVIFRNEVFHAVF